MKRGLFVCIEGISGVGKTTQVNRLYGALSSQLPEEVLISKGVNDEMKRAVTEFFTKIGIHNTGLVHNDMGIVFIFLALYAKQHDRIVQALDEGKIVIADRWHATFHAYNSVVGPISSSAHASSRRALASLSFRTLRPDITIFLDISPETAIKRFRVRNRKNSYDTLEGATWLKIRDRYLSIMRTEPNWRIIQTDQKSIEIIHTEVLDAVMNTYLRHQITYRRLQKILSRDISPPYKRLSSTRYTISGKSDFWSCKRKTDPFISKIDGEMRKKCISKLEEMCRI